VNFGGSCNGTCCWYFYGHLVFSGHLVYFTVIRYILWPLGTFYGHLVYFVVIWYVFTIFYVVQRKIWQPWL
jgi:hypothetical protein